jgi:hypothetical protein
MTRTLSIAGMVLLLLPSGLQAQQFGRERTLAFGAERISGFVFGERDLESRNNDWEQDYSQFYLLWTNDIWYLNRPRIGIDYFVIDNLNVGGSIGFVTGEMDSENDFFRAGDFDALGFLFSPRVGYLVPFTDARVVCLWPRGGFTFYTVSTDFDDDAGAEHQLAFTLDVMLAMTPVPHFTILVGPALDIGFLGEYDAGREDWDLSELSGGVQAALVGWVDL